MIIDDILKYNRNPELSDYFKRQLDQLIAFGHFPNNIGQISRKLITTLAQYKAQHNLSDVFIGNSGGIDSALTASLFKAAGWTVHGVVMPIHQKQSETDRGVEVCEKLGIIQHFVDLTPAYDNMIEFYQTANIDYNNEMDSMPVRKRAGNVKARLRMMTLYNFASQYGGIVGSTDNFSELAAGFWTLHGDVGDVAPIQSLSKSWEVPAMAEYMGVPASVIQAVPTDGLGISTSDEAQFGFSYLEFDIVLLTLMLGGSNSQQSDRDREIINSVKSKINTTVFKRSNPVNITHPQFPERFNKLQELEFNLN